MSGLVATRTEPVPWQTLQDTVSTFREECSDLEGLLQGLFDDLDRLRCELERKAMELEVERQRTAEHERQLFEQREEARRMSLHMEQQDERLKEAVSSLSGLSLQLAREHEAAAERAAQQDRELQNRFERSQAEEFTWRAKLDESHTELLRLTKVTSELAGARHELAEMRDELCALREQQAAGTESSTSEARLAEITLERDALRSEADTLRVRTVEFQQTLLDQQQEIDQQRAELTGALQQLRRFVELQAETHVQRSASKEPSTSADGVVNSVAAQFSKLQRDLNERRKSRH